MCAARGVVGLPVFVPVVPRERQCDVLERLVTQLRARATRRPLDLVRVIDQLREALDGLGVVAGAVVTPGELVEPERVQPVRRRGDDVPVRADRGVEVGDVEVDLPEPKPDLHLELARQRGRAADVGLQRGRSPTLRVSLQGGVVERRLRERRVSAVRRRPGWIPVHVRADQRAVHVRRLVLSTGLGQGPAEEIGRPVAPLVARELEHHALRRGDGRGQLEPVRPARVQRVEGPLGVELRQTQERVRGVARGPRVRAHEGLEPSQRLPARRRLEPTLRAEQGRAPPQHRAPLGPRAALGQRVHVAPIGPKPIAEARQLSFQLRKPRRALRARRRARVERPIRHVEEARLPRLLGRRAPGARDRHRGHGGEAQQQARTSHRQTHDGGSPCTTHAPPGPARRRRPQKGFGGRRGPSTRGSPVSGSSVPGATRRMRSVGG